MFGFLHILVDIYAFLADLKFEANRGADIFDRGFASKKAIEAGLRGACSGTSWRLEVEEAEMSRDLEG